MCINLVVYLFYIICSSVLFVMGIIGANDDSCKYVLTFEFIYFIGTVSYWSRIAMSCYMNLRYSRPFDECKEQFVKLFSNSEQTQS